MGMPITIEIVDDVDERYFGDVFDYFIRIDNRFSTYKPTSEISQINHGLPKDKWSKDMVEVFDLCQETKLLTDGYFDISHDGKLDPSGLVKGWAINHAANLLLDRRVRNFYVEAGGDIQAHGLNANGSPWEVGIRNPFDTTEIIKVLLITDQAVATSGTYIRGQHIYNPHDDGAIGSVKSLTVIGANIFDADRFATAAFAMGAGGVAFIEATKGLEGYSVDERKIATYTSGFERYMA